MAFVLFVVILTRDMLLFAAYRDVCVYLCVSCARIVLVALVECEWFHEHER